MLPSHIRTHVRSVEGLTALLACVQQLGEELGRGASGRVYRAFNRETGEFRAIKEIAIKDMPASHLTSVLSSPDTCCRPLPQLGCLPDRALVGLQWERAGVRASQVQSEIELLHSLQHERIVRCYETVRTSDHLYIVMELMGNGSLASIVKKFGRFPEALVATYTQQARDWGASWGRAAGLGG